VTRCACVGTFCLLTYLLYIPLVPNVPNVPFTIGATSMSDLDFRGNVFNHSLGFHMLCIYDGTST